MKTLSQSNIVEKLIKVYPDQEKRKIALGILAEGIQAASHDMENWCLQFKNVPRLVVGHYYVLTLWKPDVVWLALSNQYQDESGSLKIDHQLKDAGFLIDPAGLKGSCPHYKGRGGALLSNNGIYTLKSKELHMKNWEIVGPYFQAIFERVNSKGHRMDPRSLKHHQPAFLEFLRKVTGLVLPDINI